MFQPEGYSLDIFKQRYAFTPEETWEEACGRLARQMSIAESPDKQKFYHDKFYETLVNNYFVPGGRVWYGSGRTSPNLLNCFVLSDKLDSADGWGNLAKEMIVTSMKQGGCGIDFSDIRPRGAKILGHGGECPGPVEAMKLINGCAAPVKAGGGRRVALMFSLDLDHPDVEEFLDAKLVKGDLSYANVSVRSLRTTEFIKAVKQDREWELSWKGKYKRTIKARDLWNKIVTNAYNSAEPGFLNWELVLEEANTKAFSPPVTTNPCQPSYATVLTPDGIRTFNDIKAGSIIWSGKYWTKIIRKWSTGIKPVYRYRTTFGNFIGTENHKIIEDGIKIEVKNAQSIDWNVGQIVDSDILNEQDIMDGLVVGDGSVHKASNNLVFLFIGRKDIDYFSSEIKDLIIKERPGLTAEAFEIKTTVTYQELPYTYLRTVPERFYNGNSSKKKGFLRGLFTANGSISGNRVTLKQTSKELIIQVQEMLSSIGIPSYITVNKSKVNEFSNGSYVMKESYDLNITSGRTVFRNQIGFIQKYKQESIIDGSIPKYLTSDIKEIEYLGDEEVFDITVESEDHTYWTGGCLVSNCGEHPLSPYDCCCLGHIVLSRFIDKGDLDWHLLAETIRTGVRFLDNVLSVNHFPMLEMKETSNKLRRIGLGTTALADTLAILGYKYGSEKSLTFIDKLYRFISKQAYEASIMLALEKGEYPSCNREAVLNSGFMKRMPKKIQSLFKDYGMRNCTVLTAAPTGTVSIVSGNCSSGIEPIYAPAYDRRYWAQDERKTELVLHPLFEKFMLESKSVDHLVGSHSLTVKQHMEVQKIVQQHIDQSVSKTINIPESYPIEEVEKLWLEYLPYLKGTTFYRENSRGFVDKDGKIQEPPLVPISLEEAKERFKEKHSINTLNQEACKNGVCEV